MQVFSIPPHGILHGADIGDSSHAEPQFNRAPEGLANLSARHVWNLHMNTYKRHGFPPVIISYAVWLYSRCAFSYGKINRHTPGSPVHDNYPLGFAWHRLRIQQRYSLGLCPYQRWNALRKAAVSQ